MVNGGPHQKMQTGDGDSTGKHNNIKDSSPSAVNFQVPGGSRGNAPSLDSSPVVRQKTIKNYTKHESVTVSENMRDLIAFKLRNSLLNPPPPIINQA